jgi:hypothetical protein
MTCKQADLFPVTGIKVRYDALPEGDDLLAERLIHVVAV